MSKITEKIAKLLALAESPYEEEAKAALLQARRLMAEHKLMPEDIEPQEKRRWFRNAWESPVRSFLHRGRFTSPRSLLRITAADPIGALYMAARFRRSGLSAWRTISSSASWRFSMPMIASQADAGRSGPKRNILQRRFGRCAIPMAGASAAVCLPLSKSRRQNIRNGDWSWSCRKRSRIPFPK